MADPFDPVDSIAEEVAVGLSTRRPTFSDVMSPMEDDLTNTQAAVSKGLNSQGEPSTWRLTKDVVKGTLTGSAVQWFSMPDAGEPDPTFDEARLRARLEEAGKVLPPEWLETLGSAHSDKHFDNLFNRAVSQIDSINRIANEGFDWQTAAFLANFLDPSAIALGGVTGTLGYFGTAGLGVSRAAMIARGATAGAVGNVSIEAAQDAFGVPRSGEDYLWAAGIGLALGGAFGALARIPEASVEASNIARIGREMAESAEASRIAQEAPAPAPATDIATPTPEAPVAPPMAVSQGLQQKLDTLKNVEPPFPFVRPDEGVPMSLDTKALRKTAAPAEVPLGSLNATQDRVTSEGVKKYLSGGRGDRGDDLPYVAKYRGKYYILDGHHELTANVIQGKASARVNLVDLDKAVDTQAAVGRASEAATDPALYPTDVSTQVILKKEGVEALRAKLATYPPDKLKELAKTNGITASSVDELVEGTINKFRGRLAAAGNSKEQIDEQIAALQALRSEPSAPVRVDKAFPDAETIGAQLDELDAAARPQAAEPDFTVKLGDVEVGLNLDDAVRAIQGQADDAAEAAQTALRRLDDLPQDLKSTAYIGRYQGASGREYKIMAETAGDVSGEVRLLAREGNAPFKALARNLDNYKAAEAEILKLEGMSAPVKSEAPAPQVKPLEIDTPVGRVEITPDGTGRFNVRNREGDAGSPLTMANLSREEFLRLYQDMVRRAADADLDAATAAPADAGAAAAPTLPQFLAEPDWRSVQDADVPQTGLSGFWSFLNNTRFDRAGVTGRSQSPIVRLLGPALMNETVGKADHSLNPFAAILDQRRIHQQYANQFYQSYNPGLAEYMASNNTPIMQRGRARAQFNYELGLYVANRDPDRVAHPAVVRVGNEMRSLFKELLEDMKNPLRREGLDGRPVAGSEDVETNFSYLWRKIDRAQVIGAVNAVGEEGVIRMVGNAIRSAQPDIAPEFLERLARGYVRGIHRRAVGLGDEWSLAIGEGNYERLRQLLTEDTQLTPDEIEDVIGRLTIKKPEPGMENLKRRVFLDESWTERGLPRRDGMGTMDLSFRNLLENDAEYLFNRYLRRVSGRVALARVRIAHPRGGDLLVDGITSDGEWNQLTNTVRQWYADRTNIDDKFRDRDLKRLQFVYDRIKGNPDPAQMTEYAEWLRRTRQFNAMRLMGQVGIAQFGETGNLIGHLGLRATFAHVPGFRRIIDAAGRSNLRDPLFAELEAIGIGGERLHGFSYNNFDDLGELPFTVNRHTNPGVQRMDWALQGGERSVYELSGMSFLQQQQHRAVASAMLQRIANMDPARLGRGNRRRLAQLGVDEPMLQRILTQMDRHADSTQSLFFGNKIRRLNLQSWDDLEARARFEDAIYRTAHKVIQSNDPSSAAMWMSDPTWQTIFQFRSYSFTAYNNQFLYNIHMGDPRALMSMAWSMGWNAAVRGAQVQLQALGRSDADRFKEKHLSTWELAKAGFQRSGWSSILPMTVDTTNVLTGGAGIFDARSTGQPTDAVFGSPAGSMVTQFAKFARGVREGITDGRTISQPEARAGFGLLPFSNLPPMAIGFGHLISGLPERAPPRVIER